LEYASPRTGRGAKFTFIEHFIPFKMLFVFKGAVSRFVFAKEARKCVYVFPCAVGKIVQSEN
jgi:hypothetical protein